MNISDISMYDEVNIKIIDDIPAFCSTLDFECVRLVIAQSFGVDAQDKKLSGIKSHMSGVDILVICYDCRERFIGFGSANILNDSCVFLHGLSIDHHYQNKGIGLDIVRNIIYSAQSISKSIDYIALTTQNPNMYQLISKICDGKVMPSPTKDLLCVSPVIKKIGYMIARNKNGKFNANTFVIKNLYSSCLYKQIPCTSNLLINNWFKSLIGIIDGISCNGVVVVGQLCT